MTQSTCPRHYYLLPAERCASSIAAYQDAKQRALDAKRTIWHERYGAVAAITGGNIKSAGLIWDSPTAYRAQYAQGGWTRIKQPPRGVTVDTGRIYASPLRNTVRGKQIAADLATVQQALNEWQWALESALGIDGTVLYDDAFHKTVAHILPDGRCIASVPDDLNLPRLDTPTHYRHRSFDATTMPDWAIPISALEYQLRLAEAKAGGTVDDEES